jgi:hypothetical protein
MRNLLVVLIFGVFLVACQAGNVQQNIDNRDSLIAALNTQQDGYAGVIIETGESFTIRSTSASNTKLCRVVSIESGDRYIVESFCKVKGGAWR